MFDYKLVLLDPIMQANVVLKNNYKMSRFYITMIAIENVLLIQSFYNIIGTKFSIIWMHYFQSHQPKVVSFSIYFIYIVFYMYDIILFGSATDVKLVITTNHSSKKYSIFFTIYPLHIEALRVLEKLIQKNGITMLNATLSINQIYVKCQQHMGYHPKKTRPKGS